MAALNFKTLKDALDGLKEHETDCISRYAVLKEITGFNDGGMNYIIPPLTPLEDSCDLGMPVDKNMIVVIRVNQPKLTYKIKKI